MATRILLGQSNLSSGYIPEQQVSPYQDSIERRRISYRGGVQLRSLFDGIIRSVVTWDDAMQVSQLRNVPRSQKSVE
jgi:hypothetical protein